MSVFFIQVTILLKKKFETYCEQNKGRFIIPQLGGGNFRCGDEKFWIYDILESLGKIKGHAKNLFCK